jgi:hypothetical protein
MAARCARPLARSWSICVFVMSSVGFGPVLEDPIGPFTKSPGTNGVLWEPNRTTKLECHAKATCSDRDSGFALARSMLASTTSRVPNCHTGEQHCGERRHKEVAAGRSGAWTAKCRGGNGGEGALARDPGRTKNMRSQEPRTMRVRLEPNPNRHRRHSSQTPLRGSAIARRVRRGAMSLQ